MNLAKQPASTVVQILGAEKARFRAKSTVSVAGIKCKKEGNQTMHGTCLICPQKGVPEWAKELNLPVLRDQACIIH